MEMKVLAPAKVNWHLEVGEKRTDGFHEISSVFQKISLSDELFISFEEAKDFSFELSGLEGFCEKGKSTLDKAAGLWHDNTGINACVKVRIVKNIPSQSGLGGGSSDAASFLLALEHLAGFPSSPMTLIRTAAEVGSDVPFFISGCDAALVTGRGEFVCPIEARHDLSGLLLFPKAQKVSTKEAYAKIDERGSFNGFTYESDILSCYRKNVADWSFDNDFKAVNKRPQISVPQNCQLLLTGSGSCWVVVSDSGFTNDFVSSFDGTVIAFDTKSVQV